MSTPALTLYDGTTRADTDAFLEALDEADVETQIAVKWMIRSLMRHFLDNGHPRTRGAAYYQAARVVAALIDNRRRIVFDSLILEAVELVKKG